MSEFIPERDLSFNDWMRHNKSAKPAEEWATSDLGKAEGPKSPDDAHFKGEVEHLEFTKKRAEMQDLLLQLDESLNENNTSAAKIVKEKLDLKIDEVISQLYSSTKTDILKKRYDYIHLSSTDKWKDAFSGLKSLMKNIIKLEGKEFATEILAMPREDKYNYREHAALFKQMKEDIQSLIEEMEDLEESAEEGGSVDINPS